NHECEIELGRDCGRHRGGYGRLDLGTGQLRLAGPPGMGAFLHHACRYHRYPGGSGTRGPQRPPHAKLAPPRAEGGSANSASSGGSATLDAACLSPTLRSAPTFPTLPVLLRPRSPQPPNASPLSAASPRALRSTPPRPSGSQISPASPTPWSRWKRISRQTICWTAFLPSSTTSAAIAPRPFSTVRGPWTSTSCSMAIWCLPHPALESHTRVLPGAPSFSCRSTKLRPISAIPAPEKPWWRCCKLSLTTSNTAPLRGSNAAPGRITSSAKI